MDCPFWGDEEKGERKNDGHRAQHHFLVDSWQNKLEKIVCIRIDYQQGLEFLKNGDFICLDEAFENNFKENEQKD